MRTLNVISMTIAIFATTVAVPLHAETIEIVSQSVSYVDLDLGSPAGRKTLDRRISIAVRKVCDDPRTLNLTTLRAIRVCRHTARTIANRQRDLAISDFVARRSSDALALGNR